MATPHINSDLESIAPVVLMPGDPLRAKFIAEVYLDDYKEVNNVRNILAYTGYYKGKKVTVFASGMGIPSMGIYAYELFKFYNVETIIRVGSCGSFKSDLNLFDLILVDNSVSETSFGKSFSGYNNDIVSSTYEVNNKIINRAKELNKELKVGPIYCSESFYKETEYVSPLIEEFDCLGVEMESYALFLIAKILGKNAACILTVSDSFITKEETTSEEREKSFTNMIELALESI